MKNFTILVRMTLLLMSFIVLMISCKKDSSDEKLGFPGEELVVNINPTIDDFQGVISNKISAAKLPSLPIVDTLVDLGDGVLLSAELLTEDLSSTLPSSSNIVRSGVGTKSASLKTNKGGLNNLAAYKVFLFTKSPNAFVDSRSYISGKESESTPLSLRKGVEYKAIAISFNDDTDLDSYVIRNGSRLEDFIFKLADLDVMAGKDILFAEQDIYIDPSATSFKLDLPFRHLSSQVSVILETEYNKFGSYVTGADIALNVFGHKAAEVSFSSPTNFIRPNSESYSFMMPAFVGLNTSSTISSTAVINTANPSGKNVPFVTIKSLIIGANSYSNLGYFKNQEILPGKQYTLRIKLTAKGDDGYTDGPIPTVRIGDQIWMRHNLQPYGGYGSNSIPPADSVTIKVHGNYFQHSYSYPRGYAEDVLNTHITAAMDAVSWNPNVRSGSPKKGYADPCPEGFRVPTPEEFRVLFSNTTRSNHGNVSESPSNFAGGTMLASRKNPNIKIFFPHQGYFEGSYPKEHPIKGRGRDGYYLTSFIEHPTYAGDMPPVHYADLVRLSTQGYYPANLKDQNSPASRQYAFWGYKTPLKCISTYRD